MDDELLVQLVHDNEILYNPEKSGYKIPKQKARAWQMVAKQLGFTEEECIRRWTTLRDKYTRESRRMDPLSDSKPFTPGRWYLYDSLTFLNPYIKPRKSRRMSNYLHMNNSSDSNSNDSLPTQQQPEATVSRMKFESVSRPNFDSVSRTSFEPVSRTSFEPVSRTNFESASRTNSESAPRSNFETGPRRNYASASATPLQRKRKMHAEILNQFSEAVEAFKGFSSASNATKNGNKEVTSFTQLIGAKIQKLNKPWQNKAMKDILNYCIDLESFQDGISDECPSLAVQ